MTTTVLHTTTNSHIAALEDVFNETTEPIQWLVIAHNDSQMLETLSSSLIGKSAAVLTVSQDTWDFASKQLPETIDWALQNGEIQNLVLVGNSQTPGSVGRASLVTSAATNDSEGGYCKLLTGVRRNNIRNRDAELRFAAHFQQMLKIPVVDNSLSNGVLSVYGLFYRAESGLFLTYDADTDEFHPLVTEVSSGSHRIGDR